LPTRRPLAAGFFIVYKLRGRKPSIRAYVFCGLSFEQAAMIGTAKPAVIPVENPAFPDNPTLKRLGFTPSTIFTTQSWHFPTFSNSTLSIRKPISKHFHRSQAIHFQQLV
jgi:hypothetical protein